MELLIVLLTVIVALANLADFLIGAKGQRRVKDKLVEAYVAVATEESWLPLLRLPSEVFLSYINYLFGPRDFTWFMLKRTIMYSAVVSVMTHGLWLAWETDFGLPSALSGSSLLLMLVGSVIINIMLDLLAINMTRNIIKPASTTFRIAPYVKTLFNGVVTPVILSGVLLMFSQALEAQYLRGANLLNTTDFDWWSPGTNANFTPFDPEAAHKLLSALAFWRHWFVPRIQIILPLVVFWIFNCACLVAFALQSVIRRPLLLLLERFEEAKTGFFTAVAAGFSAIAGLIGVIQKMLSG